MTDPSGTGRWLDPALLLVYVLAAFLLYAPALENPYLIDDPLIVQEHPDVGDAAALLPLFTHHYWEGVRPGDRNLYRPLTILSFHLNARLTGLEPTPVRAVNVFWLALAAWLFQRWLRTFGVDRALSSMLGLALLAHPLQACVTNYVVGRSDLQVLVGLFGFLGLQRGAQAAGGWSRARALGAAACALLAFGSKESGVLLLPAALLQSFCARERGSLRDSMLLLGAPFALYLGARSLVVGGTREYGPGFAADPLMNPLIGLGWAERLPASLSLVFFHLRQVFVPDPSFYHVPDRLPTWGDAQTWCGGILLVGGLLAFVVALRRRSPFAIPLALVGGQLALVGQLLMPLAFYAANRLMGPFLVAAAACLGLATRERVTSAGRRAVLVALLGLGLVPMVSEVRDVGRHWASAEGLATLDLERHPDQLDSIVSYAKTMLESQRPELAAPYARRSVERRPDFAEGWYLLATAQLALGELNQARAGFQRVLDLTEGERATKSLRARSLINLGGVEIAAGDLAAGRRSLLEAEELWPADFRLLTNLAQLAEHERDVLEQVRWYRRIVEEHPRRGAPFADKLERLGRAEAQRGESFARVRLHDQAIASFDAALAVQPGDPDLLWRRACSRAAIGQSEAAEDDWQLALQGYARSGLSSAELARRRAALDALLSALE